MNGVQCWFCQSEKNPEGKAYEIRLRRGEINGALKTIYTASVDVPRCSSCQSVHQETDRARLPYGAIYKVLMVLATVSAGIALAADDARFFIVMGIVVALMGCVFIAGSNNPPAPLTRALEYPPVADRLRGGWQQDVRFGPG